MPGRQTARSRHAADATRLAREPLFCFETAVKTWYWSQLCYVLNERESDIVTLQGAMQLYGLQHFQLLWEPTCDTKCLLGWSASTVVVAFRGTASLNNVRRDLEFWQVGYPSRRGPLRSALGTKPAVHQGFVKSWTANDFHVRVLDAVYDVVYNKVRGAAGGVVLELYP